jgi:hypothetical protein
LEKKRKALEERIKKSKLEGGGEEEKKAPTLEVEKDKEKDKDDKKKRGGSFRKKRRDSPETPPTPRAGRVQHSVWILHVLTPHICSQF